MAEPPCSLRTKSAGSSASPRPGRWRTSPRRRGPEEPIRRAAQGDVAAFARIVRVHSEDMTRVAFVVIGALVAGLPDLARLFQGP